AISEIAVSRNTLLVSVLEDVSGVLYEFRREDSGWSRRRIELPDNGTISLVTTDAESGVSMVTYASFLIPDTLYLLREGGEPEAIKSLPARFDASGLISEQRFATSADGTRVPWYIVRDRNLPMDGKAPTLISAYGGFEVARTPEYFSALGIEWLKSGGVYVLANIRGGGEYGPRWHEAALLENRQKAYEDFIAVSEALIEAGITTPEKLAIRGGSNGGLLVMAVTAQRPDLYKGVICSVPLLDMLRYHKLSAGASWMAEYGNPDIAEHREFISEYSPYQNIRTDEKYPRVFFWTNTRDDRVHPSHARRMVAKMLSQGHEVIYFENTEGGHGGGADPKALAHTTAMELVYLKQQLMD
ncbi:MAG: S9 family peptidase, partial [Pseudomonadales bacterium]|nr:S9 family peptidase [Pseudomonadales bacterium]